MTRRLRRIRRRFRTASAVAAGVGIVILLPILMPIAMLLHVRDERRLRTLAQSTTCTACGATLGEAALRLADKAVSDHVAELHRYAPPGTRFRFVRNIHAICARCGTQYRFDAASRTLGLAGRELWLPPPATAG